jgi:fibronectin type 3 domain-containing protein
MRNSFVILSICACALLLFDGRSLHAQSGLAHGGPDGMYVDLGNWVLPASVGGTAVNAYRIERRVKGSREWTPVQDVTGPRTAAELSSNLTALAARFPELSDVKVNGAALFERLNTGRDLKTIGMASRLLPVQLALGVRFLDAGAERAQLTEYRISHVLTDGSVREAFVTPATAWPGAGEVAALRAHDSYGEPTAVHVTFRAGTGLPPSSFRVYRREGINGPFSELTTTIIDSCCNVTKALVGSGDTVLCVVHDKSVSKGTVFQYYAIPLDYFRNEGLRSDTATVLSFRMAQVPLPEHMKITSIDTAGLLLTWHLREPSGVHGVVIERGPKLDSGFVELYTAAPTDTSFLDMSVTPMTRYYYQLRLVGPGGLRSPSSAVLIGIYKSSDAPAPPYGVRAKGIEDGVQISWFLDTLQHLDGYYVYRSDGEGMPLRQISPLVTFTQTSYIDTSLGLDGLREYLYAVVSENSSHVRSPFSDTVAALPIIAVPVSAPRGLVARVNQGQVALFWDAQQDREVGCAGFRVYRKEGTADRWTALTDTILEGWQNYFTDEKSKPGGRYTYAVRAFNIRGDSSALSFSVKAGIDLPEVYPPANLKAQPQGRIVTLRWDEIAQSGAKEFRLYRYLRGGSAQVVATLPLDTVGYTDEIKGGGSPVFYYLTTVGLAGQESRPGKEVAVVVR